MTRYDLFNGDADGICALQQLRLHTPAETILITGIKREINLFSRIQAAKGDQITALDISFDKNRQGVQAALDAGAKVFYADHHYPGELIDSDRLELHIDTDANTCTSLIINQLLNDEYNLWALAGAYGDNLYDAAETQADIHKISRADREALKLLGTCLNYNGYGFTTDDLIYHPAELFRKVQPFADPRDFIQTDDFQRLATAYHEDVENTHKLLALDERDNGAIFILPDETWSRRVNGVFSNELARDHTARAHAVLVQCGEGCYRVSVRAPMDNKTGADELCRQFDSGGGRKAAAGINQLKEQDLARFTERFFAAF
jgi:single-stranded DNA-specific DHH superfamily exonuclease